MSLCLSLPCLCVSLALTVSLCLSLPTSLPLNTYSHADPLSLSHTVSVSHCPSLPCLCRSVPTLVPTLPARIAVQISCGDNFTMCVTAPNYVHEMDKIDDRLKAAKKALATTKKEGGATISATRTLCFACCSSRIAFVHSACCSHTPFAALL